MHWIRSVCAGGLLVALAGGASAATMVFANNAAPGDSFTNPGATNQGQPIGATGWYYNNVRNDGSVGIHTALPRNGTGSASFGSPSVAGKADLEYLAGGVAFGGNWFASSSLGFFSALTGMSYEWYRGGGSTSTPHLHPVLRVLLDADGDLGTGGDRGGLVFERAYNTPAGMLNDTWTAESVGPGTFLWNFGLGLGFAANINATPYAYDATLAEWQAYLPNAVILGFSSGVGSGWDGVFTGAVDTIGWTLGAQATSFNFEVTSVPEPASLALLGLGLAALAMARRR